MNFYIYIIFTENWNKPKIKILFTEKTKRKELIGIDFLFKIPIAKLIYFILNFLNFVLFISQFTEIPPPNWSWKSNMK